MVRALRIGIFLFVWMLFGYHALGVGAHHNPGGVLPGLPTPIILHAINNGEVPWCVDQRAASYPGFVAQLHQTNNAAFFATGIEHRRVGISFASPQAALAAGCVIFHTMPDAAMPAGVAGRIWYANWPVTVEYNWRLGYADFKTTQGHEGSNCGHAMGEHEGYDDIRFVSHLRTYGYWASPWNAPTVMDFGTGVWECQHSDVQNIHARMLPKPLQTYGTWTESDGRVFGYYCNADSVAGRRVAVMAIAPDGTPYWSGVHMPVGAGCRSLEIIGAPGWCYDFNVENGFNWKRGDLRNDVRFACL